MTDQPPPAPGVDDPPDPSLDIIVVPRARDLGGFTVQRVLPSARRKMVGPFIFLDQMGPAVFDAGRGVDVPPHPHIGLATVTYLFEGEMLHRDSVGSAQVIRPGDVNWMTAGRGIAHSERTPDEARLRGQAMFGLQMWVALPAADEARAPSFAHHDERDLPRIDDGGVHARVVAGTFLGARSPAAVLTETLLVDATLAPGARLPIAAVHEERAVFVASGTVDVAGTTVSAGPLVVLKPGLPVTVTAHTAARVVLLGGEPMDGPRHIWWNFVSSSHERIAQAKADWAAGRFERVAGDDGEFVALPAR